jgi:hypothetical protein
MRKLIAKARRMLCPLVLRIMPNPKPRTIYPAITGSVDKNACFITFFTPSPPFLKI